LIDASNDEHIWADIFERELTDIFEIQTEIALEIANKFNTIVTKEEHKTLTEIPETNQDAYEAYLKARYAFSLRERFEDAIQLFNLTIELDENYFPAYSGLSRVLSHDSQINDNKDMAKKMAEKALELDPGNAEAYSVLGTIAMVEMDWESAEKAVKKSLELNQNDAELYNWAGDYYTVVSHPILAIEMEAKALELDPMLPVNHSNLAQAYLHFGEYSKAVQYAKSGLALAEKTGSRALGASGTLFRATLKLGKIDEAEALYEESNRNNSWKASYILFYKGDLDSARYLVLERIKHKENIDPLLLIDLEMYDQAADEIEKIYNNPMRLYRFLCRYNIFPENLPNNPNLKSAFNKPGFNSLFEIRRRNLKLKK